LDTIVQEIRSRAGDSLVIPKPRVLKMPSDKREQKSVEEILEGELTGRSGPESPWATIVLLILFVMGVGMLWSGL
jgi:hypothetical protein